MAKRNILYELKWQLRHGTKQTQIQWCNDPAVINWSQKFYSLWNKVLNERANTNKTKVQRYRPMPKMQKESTNQ